MLGAYVLAEEYVSSGTAKRSNGAYFSKYFRVNDNGQVSQRYVVVLRDVPDEAKDGGVVLLSEPEVLFDRGVPKLGRSSRSQELAGRSPSSIDSALGKLSSRY